MAGKHWRKHTAKRDAPDRHAAGRASASSASAPMRYAAPVAAALTVVQLLLIGGVQPTVWRAAPGDRATRTVAASSSWPYC
ncbi:hypothetical protein ACRAWD_28795 [Caulobacter segnis]